MWQLATKIVVTSALTPTTAWSAASTGDVSVTQTATLAIWTAVMTFRGLAMVTVDLYITCTYLITYSQLESDGNPEHVITQLPDYTAVLMITLPSFLTSEHMLKA